MSTASDELLKSFDLLPEIEKHEVAKKILSRSLELNLGPMNDEELVLNAKQLFLELDREEASDGQSQSG